MELVTSTQRVLRLGDAGARTPLTAGTGLAENVLPWEAHVCPIPPDMT